MRGKHPHPGLRPVLPALLLVIVGLAFPAAAGAVPQKTANFIAQFEGFRSCVYADPAGHATIGFGHLIHLGKPTARDRRQWGCITRRRALKLLNKDLERFDRAVKNRIPADRRNARILRSLTSFAFNLGPAVLGPYTHLGTGKRTTIARSVRNGNYRYAAKQIRLYNGAIINGRRVVLPGLTTRRKKEANMLVNGGKALKPPCTVNCDPEPEPDPNGPGHGGIAAR